MRKILFHLLVACVTFLVGLSVSFDSHLFPTSGYYLRRASEARLRSELFEIRRMIDRYAADRGRLPSSLGDLVQAGYVQDIPTDPLTERKDWVVVQGVDSNSMKETSGIKDVRSASGSLSIDGTPYDEW